MVNFNILALALVFTGQSLAVTTRDHVAIRSTAAAWVEANIESLPKDYKSFSGYSLTYRKAIFHRLDEPSRAELWRSHFGSYRASHPNLTPEQNKVLDDVTAFVGSNNLTDDAAKQELARAAEAAFGAEAVEVVATLGPPIDAGDSQGNPLMKRKPLCICSTSSDYCDGDDQCRKGPTSCTQVEDECGFAWSYLCNGLCYAN
ncbi:uncharacterized protein ALTATR162_LOCUS2795 [Alternaria atra]|uniref:Uncharacterized protein n=1 Tax=Alternaria atra TaxID=119953 RepID=A0A8J2HYD3_9PLEO|nr:uncharacterized protein ALTATR162_LOCUS2795 [Alternaria atra]CAG5152503.1 unnamed protein product [Alternaria atra]